MVKILKTRDTVLEKEQLKNNLAKIASNSTIIKSSSKVTYPIPRLKDNCQYISLVYELLCEHIKLEIPIHPAGEWILDNFYIVEKCVKTISKDLSKNKYIKLPGVLDSGFARIFILANEIVSNTDGKIKVDDLVEYLEAYQTQKYLTMEEIWNLGVFLQICIIEKMRNICEKIFISQTQKYKASNIVENIIENKPNKNIKINVEGKYSFIEFMSYKLRKYGKISVPYINALEEQVKKAGMKLDEVINREHFDIAVKTLSIKNCITSIKTISRLDIAKIFKKINIVEKILNKDPAEVYSKMDYKTKSYYRTKLYELSIKTKLSEIYIAEQIIKICDENKNTEKANHVGYYLIDEGKGILLNRLLNKKIRIVNYNEKSRKYISSIYFISILVTLFMSKIIKGYALFLYIPIQNAVTHLIQYLLIKTEKTRLIPKLNYEKGIPKESATMCIIPIILKDKTDVEKIMRKMETYYLANKSENLFFTLLGDCTSSNKESSINDNEIINEGKKVTKILNDKYGEIFFFIYRKREWSSGEKIYMGWERKRGIINQYNEFLKTGKSTFMENTCKHIPKIKYVITLDCDTNLVLNSAFELVGAMSHILNKPEVDKIKNIVTKGHAIIQPRIGLSTEDGRKTTFSRLFGGNGGIDLYTNAISDIYQDNFDEAIYTGKGIYDLDIFYNVLKDSIPENTVLSHDLLEGCYLRCGLASDIVLMDGFPSKYNSYKIREHRWIRGDIQIVNWLKSDLNGLSKYKIIDNIVRNMNELFVFISTIFLLLAYKRYMIIPIIIYSIPTLLKLTDNLLNQKNGTTKHKLFVSSFSKWTQSLYKYIVQIIILPDIALLQINAICKAIFRMYISHSQLLEWTTSEEAEKRTNNTYRSYFKDMIVEIILAWILFIYIAINYNKLNIFNLTISIILAVLWSLSFFIMCMISKRKELKAKINEEEKKYLIKIAKKTWRFFKYNMVNYLPADNYQENRKEKIALRTSPTNIGLAMLSTISSFDLGFENLDDTLIMLYNILNQTNNLPKWKGHLYNWYDIKTLEPIPPYDISSVDNGNFVGYLFTVKQFLKEQIMDNKKINEMIGIIDKLIKDTDFSKLYNYENGLFSIGYSIEQNKLYDSYYDLLASEARQVSLIAIAKKDIPVKHWNNLGRTLTRLREHKGLVSWGGTAFEYLMPNINIPTYSSTLIDESCKLLILSDKEYAQKLDVPWGMSEAAYSLKDFQGNYQYKTFGIPWLGLKRGLDEDIVISPYSSALALPMNPKESIQNLKRLDNMGMVGEYGFYESIDFKPKKEIVKTYMAHHQGMILSSINNTINNNIFQKRFMNNPEIQGVKILLQENMPEDVIITKEKKEKAKRIKYNGYQNTEPRENGVNILSSNSISNIMLDNGEEYTQINQNIINQNCNVYIKNINSGKVYDIKSILKDKKEKTKIEYTPYYSKIIIEDGNIKASIKNTIASDYPAEVKKITIFNKGVSEIKIEVTTYSEPILSSKQDHYAHPTYNKMFLKYEYQKPFLIVERKSRKELERTPYLATTLLAEGNNIEYEIDKEKIMSRGNKEIPEAITNSKQLTCKNDTVINPIIAFRRMIDIEPNESKDLYLISSMGYEREETINNLKYYINIENVKRVFDLAKEQTEAEIRYMGITENEVNVFQNIAKYLLESKQKAFERYSKKEYIINDINLSNQKLWKYGISGDYPIIVLKIKEKNDYDIVTEIFKAYEYLSSKNFSIELVILTDKETKNEIINDKINKYLNTRGGIFVIEDIKYDESKIIEARSNLVIDSHNGSLDVQIKEMKKEIKDTVKKESVVYEQNNTNINQKDFIKTKYYKSRYKNGYGEFNKECNEYWIKQSDKNRIPVAWSNIMANKNFGTVITDSFGGFTWYINSQTNRITKFTNDAYMDDSSEKIVIKGYEKTDHDYYAGFGFGYAHFIRESNELEQKITVFVPPNDSIKITILRLKNNSSKEMNLDIKYDLKLVMAENENNSIIVENYKKNLNMILAKNLMNTNYLTYISSNEKIDENKEIHIKILPEQEREVVFILGAQNTEMECIEKSAQYLSSYSKEFENTKKYWEEKVSHFVSKTPLKSFDVMQNGYLVYQTLASRLYGRTGFYQSSGGYGFRDQLQDAIGMKWVDPNILKNQILLNARHQFSEGDVEHWWHEDTNLGIRTRYSDDLLWLVYAVEEYIDFTGDFSILDKKERFIKASLLTDNENDRVDYYTNYDNEETIFEHCCRALKIASHLGNNNLPLIKQGDWNDGMNNIGKKGKGESIWLGFFLYSILSRFIEIVNYMQKNNQQKTISKDLEVELNQNINKKLKPTKIEDYNRKDYDEMKNTIIELQAKIKNALNTIGWDGRWYLRAINDEGEKIGSINNEECIIDSISQSFSVLSGGGDNDKKYIAMASLENYLIDNENNLVKLLTPPLKNINLGYISSYAKGMRENGGQYTHAAIWAMMAEIVLNKPEEAMNIYKKINPIEHTKSTEGVLKYKVEPYVVEADIYSEGSLAGRGGWTWYTGSSSWLYEAQIKYILGINIHHGQMTIKPCVPKEWKKFKLRFKWKSAVYHIYYYQIGEYKINILENNRKLFVNSHNAIQLKEEGEYEIQIYF